MNDLTDYTLATTIAVVLLALMQIITLIVLSVLGIKLIKVIKKVNQTASMSKEFVSALREQQIKNTSMVKLGIFAFKKYKKMKR